MNYTDPTTILVAVQSYTGAAVTPTVPLATPLLFNITLLRCTTLIRCITMSEVVLTFEGDFTPMEKTVYIANKRIFSP